MAEQVQLYPVTEADLSLLARLHNTWPAAGSAFEWFGYADPARAQRRWSQDGLLGADSGTLMVRRGEEAVGSVTWRSTPFGPLNRGWNIGIGLVPEAQGAGIGTRAQELLVEYLFDHTEVHRIDAQTNILNLAEQRALEKAGFVREGILRGAQFRSGEYHDMVSYSILRSDRSAARTGSA
ncbi:GNAT family N-acetyltransferase [Kribbella italica]|uniref:RimJ/RimL family protein N-acetyltransferase n=1 Tax=Kribbella italica TaxID=1540520 RepID=A0A7W9J5J9_9ACTN|nr:GNAT family protein [Kribbella italica]MBB5835913.1 RimJ/RimL family protein N-acetyltransferase [Kribbella italica]